jgi:hypothetical protein
MNYFDVKWDVDSTLVSDLELVEHLGCVVIARTTAALGKVIGDQNVPSRIVSPSDRPFGSARKMTGPLFAPGIGPGSVNQFQFQYRVCSAPIVKPRSTRYRNGIERPPSSLPAWQADRVCVNPKPHDQATKTAWQAPEDNRQGVDPAARLIARSTSFRYHGACAKRVPDAPLPCTACTVSCSSTRAM